MSDVLLGIRKLPVNKRDWTSALDGEKRNTVLREQERYPECVLEGAGHFLRKLSVCLALKDMEDFGEWRSFKCEFPTGRRTEWTSVPLSLGMASSMGKSRYFCILNYKPPVSWSDERVSFIISVYEVTICSPLDWNVVLGLNCLAAGDCLCSIRLKLLF